MVATVRILCVFACLDRGGAETMCMNLYRHIDKEKVQFDFIKHVPDTGEYEAEIRRLGGQIYIAPRYRIYNHREYCTWWRKHLKNHPEHKVVHGHFITAAAVYFRIAKQMNCKTIAHSHSTKPRGNMFQQIVKKWYVRGVKKYSDYCFACSDLAGKRAFSKGFSVLKNAIDVERFKYDSREIVMLRDKFGLKEKTFVVGTVGSLSAAKNPFGMIEIFKAIHRRKSDAKLLWVGDGGMREEIERKLEEDGLKNSVIMTGVREDVGRLMQAMDVFIFPSLWEGLGIAAIEAQAAGLPCFISDTVPREVAITELCTFLPNNKPEQWADAILAVDISGRKETSAQIKKAGYDIEDTSKQMEEFYLSLMT